MISFNKRVARILEDSGAVPQDAIRSALDAADQSQRHLSSVLVEKSMIDERLLLGLPRPSVKRSIVRLAGCLVVGIALLVALSSFSVSSNRRAGATDSNMLARSLIGLRVDSSIAKSSLAAKRIARSIRTGSSV